MAQTPVLSHRTQPISDSRTQAQSRLAPCLHPLLAPFRTSFVVILRSLCLCLPLPSLPLCLSLPWLLLLPLPATLPRSLAPSPSLALPLTRCPCLSLPPSPFASLARSLSRSLSCSLSFSLSLSKHAHIRAHTQRCTSRRSGQRPRRGPRPHERQQQLRARPRGLHRDRAPRRAAGPRCVQAVCVGVGVEWLVCVSDRRSRSSLVPWLGCSFFCHSLLTVSALASHHA